MSIFEKFIGTVISATLFSAVDLHIRGGAVSGLRTISQGRFKDAFQTNNPDGSSMVFVPDRASAVFLVDGKPVKVDDYKKDGGSAEIRFGGSMVGNRMEEGDMRKLSIPDGNTIFQVGNARIVADYHK